MDATLASIPLNDAEGAPGIAHGRDDAVGSGGKPRGRAGLSAMDSAHGPSIRRPVRQSRQGTRPVTFPRFHACRIAITHATPPSSRRGTLRRGGRAVECTALEMRHACKGIGGSNPPLSAKTPIRGHSPKTTHSLKSLMISPGAVRVGSLARAQIRAIAISVASWVSASRESGRTRRKPGAETRNDLCRPAFAFCRLGEARGRARAAGPARTQPMRCRNPCAARAWP